MDETKTLPLSWKKRLQQTAQRLKAHKGVLRLAIVGVGHELHGDDAAGIVAARRLPARVEERAGAKESDPYLILEGGTTPENQTGRLRRFQPDLVILIDAAQMDAEPGAAQWLERPALEGISASTHTFPLDILARFLTMTLGCELALIGIQPAAATLAGPDADAPALTPAVEETVNQVSDALADLIVRGEERP